LPPKSQSPVKRLPSSLQRPLGPQSGDIEREAALRSLLAHYGLLDDFDAMAAEPPGTTSNLRRSADVWGRLAHGLMSDFIPAFRSVGKRGRRPIFGRPDPVAWALAGGTILGAPSDMTSFYQAQFVLLVERLKSIKGQRRANVFRWLANESEKVRGHREAERRAMLPLPYRRRVTSASLSEAFRAIPKEIRRDPKAHLANLLNRPTWYLDFLEKRPAA
jgi:hypothetical protein